LNSIILYTQNPIFDSEGKMGPLMILPDSNVTLQFLQCFRSLVPQIGQVDAGSKTIIPNSLHPMLYENHSTWKSFNEISQTANNPTSLVEGDYVSRIDLFSYFFCGLNAVSGHGFSLGSLMPGICSLRLVTVLIGDLRMPTSFNLSLPNFVQISDGSIGP
jgi:hypothetical protein